MDRRTKCEYPVDSSTAAIAHWHEKLNLPISNTLDPFTQSPDDLTLPDFPAGQAVSGNAATGNMESNMGGDDMNMDWEFGLNDGNPMDFWNSRAWNLTPTEVQALSSNITSKGPPIADMILPAVSTEALNSGYHDSDFLADVTADYQPTNIGSTTELHDTLSSPIVDQSSNLEPGSKVLPASPPVRTNTRKPSETPKTRTSSINARHTSPKTNAPRLRASKAPSARHSASPQLGSSAILASPDGSRKTSPGQSNAFSETNSPSDSSSTPPSTAPEEVSSKEIFSVSDIMKVICDYPKQMLRHNFWSPFVHHRHYRCSLGGLSEPMAVALCCVSANLQNAESSLPFLCNLISTERERIVSEFPTKSANLENAVAALHAMCIYQIETILVFRSQKSVKQQLSNAELYHHFLLKMTRRLCQEHTGKVLLKDNDAISWQTWTIIETLRRTAFLVDMVNELSHHSNALNLVYYEPLDPSLILDMPLPSPDSMWRATNEDEWIAARDSSGWKGSGVLTMREAMNRSATESFSSGGLQGRVGKRDNIEQISNLIISSAMLLRQRHGRQQPQLSLQATV
ncbi:MAG: hypothetical protein LQ352_005067 [Teloschistes flavicans]|nr:MAG: hypothetical protein LQ352_005067 [Teloschistes flavicans]